MSARIMLFPNYSLLHFTNFVALLTQVSFCHTLKKFNYVYTFDADV